MFIVTKKVREAVVIEPAPGVNLFTPISDLFADGPIEIVVLGVDAGSVRLGIKTDARLHVVHKQY